MQCCTWGEFEDENLLILFFCDQHESISKAENRSIIKRSIPAYLLKGAVKVD
jgi:hypothetical protein